MSEIWYKAEAEFEKKRAERLFNENSTLKAARDYIQTNLTRSLSMGVEFASELASMRILLKKYRDIHLWEYPDGVCPCELCAEADLLLQGEVTK